MEKTASVGDEKTLYFGDDRIILAEGKLDIVYILRKYKNSVQGVETDSQLREKHNILWLGMKWNIEIIAYYCENYTKYGTLRIFWIKGNEN